MENLLQKRVPPTNNLLTPIAPTAWQLTSVPKEKSKVESIKLSIVIPLYNEAAIIATLFARLCQTIESIAQTIGISRQQIEVIFVNDGSTDTTFFQLKTICEQHAGFLTINLSRNFGHQIASTAGLEHTRGDFVVIMDGDLQDPPEMILSMYEKAMEGFEVVYAKRISRAKESAFKLWTAKLFYRLMSRRVVDEMNAMPERHRFIRGLTSWVGFRQTAIEYERAERFSGTTKYPLKKMVAFAIDGLTSFSSLPLRLASLLGYIFTFLSALYFCYVLYKKFWTDDTVQGWSSIVVVVLLIGGIQFILLGMMGEYVGRIYDEVKQRPLYIVEAIYQKEKE
ncbi:MAG: glycosyltransferase family 2 protein [Bacteroidota bacterium]